MAELPPSDAANDLASRAETAMGVHQRGDLDAAEKLYHAILAEDPNHFTVTHLLGVLNNQKGDFTAAVQHLTRALSLNPRSALAHFHLGLVLWNQDRHQEALNHYAHALALKPDNPDALLHCALALQEIHQPQPALERWDQLLALGPVAPFVLLQRGMALQDLHRSAEALASFGQALALQPELIGDLLDHCRALGQARRPEEALATLDLLLSLQPQHPEALLFYGGMLLNLGRAAEALETYDRLLAIAPDSADLFLDRGNALMRLKRCDEALASYDRVVALAPDRLDGLMNRATALLELHRPQQALESYERVLALRPDHADSHLNHGNALLALGRPEEALASFDRALALRPANALALLNRANALLALKRPAEALASCDSALALQPDCVDALINRGTAFLDLKRPEEALGCFDAALALQPDSPDLLLNHGTALHLLGRHREAIGSYERALALDPGHARAHSNKIYLLDFLPAVGFLEHQLERRSYFQAHAKRFAAPAPGAPRIRKAQSRLVLGYVSADFKHHSAASCFLPILERHSRKEFQVICYSGVQVEDDWTRRFHACAEVWRATAGMTDDELADRIRADGVDILIDLSGHSKGNRLLVFARKPAPIQVTAWGHGGGTGLPAIDYQFTDPVSTPAQVRPLFAETAWDLPCCITFEAPAFAPAVGALPARTRGQVSFGSLNRFTKVTPGAEQLWAQILHAVPGSRLLLKDGLFDSARGRSEVLASFARLGIPPERLELRGFTSRKDHLAACGEMDLMLDTFPQNGGITTWEALWMGLPVITMLGNKPASRISGAILYALGRQEWVGQDESEYLRIAVQLASDLDALEASRRDLRSRILASPAGNPDLYTRAVEDAYRAMWEKGATH